MGSNMKKLWNQKTIIVLIAIGFAAIIALVNIIVYEFANTRIEKRVLEEKYIEVVDLINMLGAAVDGNPNRYWEEHEENIVPSIEFLDRKYRVYGAIYKPADNGFELITERFQEPIQDKNSFSETLFNPFDYQEFIDLIDSKESGQLMLRFKPDGDISHDLHVYYRYMPLYAPPEERYLVIGGLSKYSIVTNSSLWIFVGQCISSLVTTVLGVLLVNWLMAYYTKRDKDND